MDNKKLSELLYKKLILDIAEIFTEYSYQTKGGGDHEAYMKSLATEIKRTVTCFTDQQVTAYVETFKGPTF